MVYRVYVEKKKELANEAKGLLSEANNLLGIKNLTDVRIFNRYDAENITEELKAKDQMEWVRKMNNISNIADEIVLNMYVYDDEN